VSRTLFFTVHGILLSVPMFAGLEHLGQWLFFLLVLASLGVGLYDMHQTTHTLRRNFPLLARARWGLESLRPFVQQYFLEKDTDGAPINRMARSIVYQRAKGDLDSVPFGTRLDTDAEGYEWMAHSIAARDMQTLDPNPRVSIGEGRCALPYRAALLNVSAMSFGALSSNALRALNRGAAAGGFYHNTGEGGLSDYHLESGADLVWQIGTGYFGCRDESGNFDAERFRERATLPQVKMIEVKLSQGAKPGHGGMLPASKNSELIARIRQVTPHTEVISPSAHRAFSTPLELLQFLGRLRELSGGKPVGFKLCVGDPAEFIAICKAALESGEVPDFVTVDGAEGGTGAAPLEYSNHVGMPLRDGLAFVVDTLTGFGLREQVRVIAAGKIITAFHLARALALGADLCNSARGMMLSMGCVQSLECNTNRCPTGITTQDPKLVRGLDPADKGARVARYQAETIRALLDLTSSAGLSAPGDISRRHIYRRLDSTAVKSYADLYPLPSPGSYLEANASQPIYAHLRRARSDRFHSADQPGENPRAQDGQRPPPLRATN
jgi:glutamate synthase domain-containing protein 2